MNPHEKNKTAKAPKTGLAARQAALTGLLAIRDGRTMDEALNPLLPKLDERDRALAKRIATGTLRSMATLDQKAKQYLKTQLPAKAIRARLVLNMGLYQLADSDSPEYAIRATCLDLLETRKSLAFKPLVDAILRRAGEKRGDWRTEFATGKALWLPHWLKAKWTKDHGEAVLQRTVQAASNIPRTDLNFVNARALEAFTGELSTALPFLRLSPVCLRLGSGHGAITKLPFFKEGTWWVQDFAAGLPVRLLADGFKDGLAGKNVLDLCAAPGGKSLQLAAMGANVTAVEISKKRAERLSQNTARCARALAGSITVVIADALKTDALKNESRWDAILLDAPCSASGTLRRHPEWPYLRRPETHLNYLKLQARLMFKAASLLSDQGKLVYAVCSIDPEEGMGHLAKIKSVLQPDPDLNPESALAGNLMHEGFVRTFPFTNAVAATDTALHRASSASGENKAPPLKASATETNTKEKTGSCVGMGAGIGAGMGIGMGIGMDGFFAMRLVRAS